MSVCNTSSIAEYVPSEENPWDFRKVNHLFRRTKFGAHPTAINEALLKTPQEVVDEIIDESVNLENPTGPGWKYTGDLPFSALALRYFVQVWFTDHLISNYLKYRLTLFWSNHFVTSDITARSPRYAAQYYYDLLIPNSLGNFRTFVYEAGLDSAMLLYLNGSDNEKTEPNENYARELYELFTLGVDNGYTQEDIEETARALTGWTTHNDDTFKFEFNPNDFDDGEKTIFGQTGNWGYDDVIRILFEEHSDRIAKFICTKFYNYFVSTEIDETIVDALATTFLENDFEIVPVLSQLFKSEHFFDPAVEGVIIKSPHDIQLCFSNELGSLIQANYAKTQVIPNTTSVGQEILNPPDVAGWQGDLNWISANDLILRWEFMSNHLSTLFGYRPGRFKVFVTELMVENTQDVELVARTIMNFFVPRPSLLESDYQEGISFFKSDVPENYFEDGTWDLNYESINAQVLSLLEFIITLPEFQLK